MSKDLQRSLHINGLEASTILPPAMIEESAWDILLALRLDRRCDLGLAKLASLVSVTPAALQRGLATLEDRRFITGATHVSSGELRAVLTEPARRLLDTYLSASSDLQVGAHH